MSTAQAVRSDACGRDPLVAAITTFLAREDARLSDGVRELLEREIDAAGPDVLNALGRRLAATGRDWAYYPRDPLARRIHHLLADHLLERAPRLRGAEHLPAVERAPVVIIANHLSYSDANVLDVALSRGGARPLADRMTVVAGPKVYSNVRRRFSSLCFATIKTPQSSSRSTGEAVMQARDVARAARHSIRIAQERLRLGDALVVFAEGTRSRTGEMQPLLSGVARYLTVPGTWILPAAIVGSETLFPIDEAALNPVPIEVTIGQPMRAADVIESTRGNRRLIMDTIGRAVARLLPARYRGVYSHF